MIIDAMLSIGVTFIILVVVLLIVAMIQDIKKENDND